MTDEEILTLQIDEGADGKTVKQLLKEELRFSMHQISRVKYRPAGFSVNGTPCTVNQVLRAGDRLAFAIEERTDIKTNDDPTMVQSSEKYKPFPVLYEDEWILVIDKPAGIVSHPSHGHHGDSALEIMRRVKGRLYLVGRLDKDTSGVLLFAKHQETASLLSKQKGNGRLSKVYSALVEGIPVPPKGTIDAPIGTLTTFPLKMQVGGEDAKAAVTHYETRRTIGSENSLLRVIIDHGRTHQIRVHMASIGHPLVGDALYGTADPAVPYAQLRAEEVIFRHPYLREEIRICC